MGGGREGRVSNVPILFAFSSSLLAHVSIDYCVIEGHTLRGTPCLVLTFFFSQHPPPASKICLGSTVSLACGHVCECHRANRPWVFQ